MLTNAQFGHSRNPCSPSEVGLHPCPVETKAHKLLVPGHVIDHLLYSFYRYVLDVDRVLGVGAIQTQDFQAQPSQADGSAGREAVTTGPSWKTVEPPNQPPAKSS